MDNPFDRFDSPSSGALVPVPLPDKPRLPSPQTPAQARKDTLEVKKLEMDLAKKDPANQPGFRDINDKLLGVVDAAANAHRMTRQSNLTGTTSLGRSIGAKLPGTAAKDIGGYLDTIKGNTAFQNLQQMRQESPTGGAVGNVSDTDMRLLASTIASLDPTQSTPKFQKDLSTVLRAYQKVLYKLPGGKDAYHNWREGWLGRAPQTQQGEPRVIDFNDLP